MTPTLLNNFTEMYVLFSTIWVSLKLTTLQFRKGSDGARGDDANRLKLAVVDWINERYGPSELPLVARCKTQRGFVNEHTGRLLCPTEFSWDDER